MVVEEQVVEDTEAVEPARIVDTVEAVVGHKQYLVQQEVVFVAGPEIVLAQADIVVLASAMQVGFLAKIHCSIHSYCTLVHLKRAASYNADILVCRH